MSLSNIQRMLKTKRFLAVADNHGDQADEETVRAVLEFKKDFKPDIRVHLGDNWDLRNLRNGASDEDKNGSLSDDWDQGFEFFREFFEGDGENHFLFGNHDDRIIRASESTSGQLRDYADDKIKAIRAECRRFKVRTYPYDAALGVCQIGKLKAIHGYHAGQSAARAHANVYGNVIFGHCHTIESAAVPSLDPAESRSIGCLCKRDMNYINAKTGKLRWGQGWAYGFVFPDGSYQLYQTRKIKGEFHAATGIKTY